MSNQPTPCPKMLPCSKTEQATTSGTVQVSKPEEDCVCHYIIGGVFGLIILVPLTIFSVGRSRQYLRDRRERKREELRRKIREEEQRIMDSTNSLYRSAPPQ